MKEQDQQQGKKVVMAFGTFDFFHAGHEHYLKRAKALGDYLIVVIARDKTVAKIKGEAPVHPERKRAKTVRKSEIADKVVLGSHHNKHKVIEKYRPDVIALGYDQFVFTQKLKKTLIDLQLNATIERIDSHHPRVYKSSLIKAAAQKEQEEEFTSHPIQSF